MRRRSLWMYPPCLSTQARSSCSSGSGASPGQACVHDEQPRIWLNGETQGPSMAGCPAKLGDSAPCPALVPALRASTSSAGNVRGGLLVRSLYVLANHCADKRMHSGLQKSLAAGTFQAGLTFCKHRQDRGWKEDYTSRIMS